jgi:hypothetical protein
VPDKQPTSFRLTENALTLLAALAKREGIDKTDVLEILIRERARGLGIPEPEEPSSATP